MTNVIGVRIPRHQWLQGNFHRCIVSRKARRAQWSLVEPGQAQDPRNDAMAQTLPVLAACRQYWCGAREEENAREVSYHRGFAYQNNPDYRKSKEKQPRASLLAIRESERETEGNVFCHGECDRKRPRSENPWLFVEAAEVG